MKHILQYNIFENSFYITELNNQIAEIIKKSGYIVSTHGRIYADTLVNKTELLSTTYNNVQQKYSTLLYVDTCSLKKLNYNPENYLLNDFIYPIEMLEKLYDNVDVINYKELDFFPELFNIVKIYKKRKKANKFNL